MLAPLKSDGSVRLGSLLIVLSAASFVAGGAAVKALAEELNPIALLFWRNALSMLLVLVWFGVRGFPPLPTRWLAMHFLRSVLTYVGLVAFFVAVTHLPIANAVLLRATNPLFVPILALIVYRRMSDLNVWVGVMTGLIGIILVTAPDAASWALSYGNAAGVFSGAMGGAAALAIWALSKEESPQTQIFYFSLISVACATLPLPWFWQLPGRESLPNLLYVALFTTLAQALLAAGCAIAPADKILPWSYTAVVFGAVIGLLWWNEVPTLGTIVGMTLAIGGASLASRRG
ncbi:MAG: DMT family transporter [Hyphomicrobium sp.]